MNYCIKGVICLIINHPTRTVFLQEELDPFIHYRLAGKTQPNV